MKERGKSRGREAEGMKQGGLKQRETRGRGGAAEAVKHGVSSRDEAGGV